MKVAVMILPKPEVLDTQGRAVQNTLTQQGYELKGCRIGKYIVVDIDTQNEKAALKEAEKMAQSVLHNNLIETYQVELIEES
jgi:phosphoribosylformylglycinamidine synthase subunit PurS